MFGLKRLRRRRWRDQPFPDAWRTVMEKNVPYYRLLDPAEQKELQGHVQVFLKEKRFEGIDGLKINDEIRVTIAAQACILLLNRETDYYPTLISILVYPHSYQVQNEKRRPDGTVEEREETRLGESWYRGEVVLSWTDVRRGSLRVSDGHNVVFHEFAHQLDSESGSNEGVPALPHFSMYPIWSEIFAREYDRLLDDLEHHRPTVLRSYGAESPAEFFAVATEAFFEKPLALRERHPDLYEQLQLYYQQDPARRFAETMQYDA